MTATTTAPTRARRSSRARPEPRRDIQGLRAVAVLAVIADHLFAWPSGGFVGVDVFFVISGFLITGILLKQYDTEGTISARVFYGRRIKRIVPAATLVLLVTVGASIALLPIDRVKTIGGDAVAAFFFASNWRFAHQGTDYFAEGLPPSPLQHYWSLSIEEQFYFVWPWLMLGVLVVGTRLFSWERRHGRLVAAGLMGVIIAASLGWALRQTATDPDYAYFSTFTRVWELGLGALVAIAAPRLRLPSPALRALLGWIGLVGIVASLFVVSAGDGFPAPWAALPVLSTALVIAAGIGGDERAPIPLTNRGAQYVGNISYSLYLWHFPVIVLLAALVETETLPYYGIALVLIAGLSVGSFHLVEDKLRSATWIEVHHGRRSLAYGWRYAVGAVLTIAFLTLVAYSLVPSHYTAAATSPFTAPGKSATQDIDPPDCLGAAVMAPGSTCPLNEGPTFYPSVDKMLDDDGDAYECWFENEPMQTCHYGAWDGKIRVALVGDSHAAMLLPALKDASTELGIQIDTYTGLDCQWRTDRLGDRCSANEQIQHALETGNYDAIITQSSRANTDGPEAFTDAWRRVGARTKIIVVADNPLVTSATMACVQRIGFDPAKDDCSTPVDEALTEDVLLGAAREVPGVQVVDLTDYFCDDTECPAVIGNVLVYRDTAGHITGTFSRTLAPFLARELRPLLGQGNRTK